MKKASGEDEDAKDIDSDAAIISAISERYGSGRKSDGKEQEDPKSNSRDAWGISLTEADKYRSESSDDGDKAKIGASTSVTAPLVGSISEVSPSPTELERRANYRTDTPGAVQVPSHLARRSSVSTVQVGGEEDTSGAINVREIEPMDAKVTIATPTIVAEPVTGDDYTEELEQQVIEHKQKIKLQQEKMTNMEIRQQSERSLQLSQKERINQLESEHLQERHNYKKILLTSGATVLIVAICVILALVIPESRSVSGKNAAIDSPTPAPFLELQSEETCEAIANDDGTYTFEFVEGVEIEVVLEVSTDYETDIDEIMPQVETFVQEELLPYLSGCAIDDSRRLLAQAVIGSSIRGSRALETYDSNIIVFARIVDPIEVDGLCSSAVGGLICRRLSTLVKLYLDEEVGCEAMVDGLTSSFTRSFEKASGDLGAYPSFVTKISVENCRIAITPGPTDRPSLAPITAIPTTKTPTKSPSNRPTKAPFLGTAPPTESTPRPTKSPTREPTPNPTPDPTPQPTPNPNLQPTPNQSPQPTPNPTPQPTPDPTPEPTPNPTPDPTPQPTPNPTPQPTPNPTPQPTPNPIPEPTPQPTPNPTPQPTPNPTPNPTPQPTPNPTPQPTPNPTPEPTPQPTPNPTPFSITQAPIFDLP